MRNRSIFRGWGYFRYQEQCPRAQRGNHSSRVFIASFISYLAAPVWILVVIQFCKVLSKPIKCAVRIHYTCIYLYNNLPFQHTQNMVLSYVHSRPNFGTAKSCIYRINSKSLNSVSEFQCQNYRAALLIKARFDVETSCSGQHVAIPFLNLLRYTTTGNHRVETLQPQH